MSSEVDMIGKHSHGYCHKPRISVICELVHYENKSKKFPALRINN